MSDAGAKPVLAITMGDPAGVGPEVVVRAWRNPRVHALCRPVAVGLPEAFQRAIELIGAPMKVETLDSLEPLTQMGADPGDLLRMAVIPVGNADALDAPDATVDARSGQAAYEAVVRAARGAIVGQFDGVVTAPLNKAALHAAGHHYPGHTELLADLCGVEDFAMMLYLPKAELSGSRAGLGVVHTTLHCPLREVPQRITAAEITAKCLLAQGVMREGFGLERPRVGVCALNPHAGEDDLFGDEETRIIAPAVEAARAAGVEAEGPFPTDTLMVRAAAGEFDAVVAMYHDQGHIALKLLGMHRAVNITLGLPIVRTSVAHGTAFDRAWQGKAEGSGMVAAVVAAAELARRRFPENFAATSLGTN
jgi:4-hydroxythreonine-4-phosphate dehydrogenase